MQWIVSIKSCYFFFKTKYNFTEKLLMKRHISFSMRILIKYRHGAPWCRRSYWNEKNISTWYENEKESTNQGGHVLDFYRFSWSYAGPKSNLHPCTEISSIAATNPQIVYMPQLFSNTLYWLILFFNAYSDRKFIRF